MEGGENKGISDSHPRWSIELCREVDGEEVVVEVLKVSWHGLKVGIQNSFMYRVMEKENLQAWSKKDRFL